jgi:sugar lactone lactonase YvrE
MLIALYTPGEIVRFNFATGATTMLVKNLKSCDGIAYDPYGNLYAVANHNTIVQINPATGAILNTLVLEPHKGINGGDGLTYDSYTGSLWTTHNGTTGYGLVQIPITSGGLGSSSTLYLTPTVHNPDGIKSDGKGNLYIGAIWTMAVYNIPTNTVTKNIVVKGADGVSLVPGTY